jgi:DNA-binding response OmpR family regulator
MKILICDDDPALANLIRFKLQQEDMAEVYTATNGEKAMKLINSHSFDLLITDIHMPYHNGDAVMRSFKRNASNEAKVIMMSADGEEEVKNLAKKEGVFRFLTKPFDVQDLVRIVKRLRTVNK